MTQPDDLAFTNLLRVDGTDPYDGFKPVGLTKREYFAAMAIVPEFLVHAIANKMPDGREGLTMIKTFIIEMKIEMADALIAELNKKTQT
jgi:hypothetical protein